MELDYIPTSYLRTFKHDIPQNQVDAIQEIMLEHTSEDPFLVIREIVGTLIDDSVGHPESMRYVAERLLDSKSADSPRYCSDSIATAIIRYHKTPADTVESLYDQFGDFAYRSGLESEKLSADSLRRSMVHASNPVVASAIAVNTGLPEDLANQLWSMGVVTLEDAYKIPSALDIRRLIAERDTQSLDTSMQAIHDTTLPMELRCIILRTSEKLPGEVREKLFRSSDEDEIRAAAIFGLEMNHIYFSHPYRHDLKIDYSYEIYAAFKQKTSSEYPYQSLFPPFHERTEAFKRETGMAWEAFVAACPRQLIDLETFMSENRADMGEIDRLLEGQK